MKKIIIIILSISFFVCSFLYYEFIQEQKDRCQHLQTRQITESEEFFNKEVVDSNAVANLEKIKNVANFLLRNEVIITNHADSLSNSNERQIYNLALEDLPVNIRPKIKILSKIYKTPNINIIMKKGDEGFIEFLLTLKPNCGFYFGCYHSLVIYKNSKFINNTSARTYFYGQNIYYEIKMTYDYIDGCDDNSLH